MRIIGPGRTCRGREASRRSASIGRWLVREAPVAVTCVPAGGDVASSDRFARSACKSCTSPTLVVVSSCLLLARRNISRTQVKWDGAPSALPAGREPARYRSEARFGLAESGRHLRAAQVMRVTTASEGSSRARARRAEDQRIAQLYSVGDQKFLVLEGPSLSRRAGRIARVLLDMWRAGAFGRHGVRNTARVRRGSRRSLTSKHRPLQLRRWSLRTYSAGRPDARRWPFAPWPFAPWPSAVARFRGGGAPCPSQHGACLLVVLQCS